MKKKIIILGAGLSGISLGYFLKEMNIDFKIYEKNNKIGGVCSSKEKDGFIFDIAGHLLHFKKSETLWLIKTLMGDRLSKLHRNASIYKFGYFIPYPFQVNLSALPIDIFKYCLSEFIKARVNRYPVHNTSNFSDWTYRNFGAGIADHFMIPYNLKFWRIPLEELSSAWAENMVVRPTLRDIMEAKNGKRDGNLGYHSYFYYPKRGGIIELIKAFSDGINESIFLGKEAIRVDLKNRRVEFDDGSNEKYDILVSTIPLPELGKILIGASEHILSCFRRLKWLSIYNINLGIDCPIQTGRHWIYFPDEETSFFRIGFFHNFSPYMVPPGKGALYVEVSYSQDNPISKGTIIDNVMSDLRKVGIFDGNVRICCKDVNDIKYAYPIYDKNYSKTRKEILKFLIKSNILSCGRYGSWRYFSMEDVILESKKKVCFFA